MPEKETETVQTAQDNIVEVLGTNTQSDESNDSSPTVTNDNKSGNDYASYKDITNMVNSMNDLGRSIELNRQLVDAREQLEDLCFQLGLSADDQEFFNDKFTNTKIADADFNRMLTNKEELDSTYFTREDGTVISFSKEVCKNMNETEGALKVYFARTLRNYYNMENEIETEIDDINSTVKEFNDDTVADFSNTVANTLKQAIAERRDELDAITDPVKRKQREKLLSNMESGYTFKELIDTLNRYPSIIPNTIRELNRTPNLIVYTGDRYRTKLKQQKCVSTLFGTIDDSLVKSIEKQFLTTDQYDEGYENLFAYSLIRFFSRGDWTSPTEYMKEMHNATVIVLTNLVAGRLNPEFRDEVVANIAKVWELFRPYTRKDS